MHLYGIDANIANINTAQSAGAVEYTNCISAVV